MCVTKKQMYDAEYFFNPCTQNNKTNFKKLILLKRGFQNVYFYLPDTFTFKLGATEGQDVAKRPNFEFSQLQPSLPPPPLMVSENLK